MTSDLEEVLENSGLIAFAVDPKQRVTLWNAEAEKLTCVPAAQALGKPCWEVFAAKDARGRRFCRQSCRLFLRANFDRRVRPVDLLVRQGEGRQLWTRVITLVVPSRRGERATLYHILQDIDDLKQAESVALRVLDSVAKLPPRFVQAARASAVSTDPRESAVSEGEQELKELALAHGTRPKELTVREQEVLELLAQGADTAAIAEKLIISQATVRNHVQRILGKLGVHSRLEAAIAAFTGY